MSGLPDRIQNKIEVFQSGCWIWISTTNRRGYGIVGFDGSSRLAHRLVYSLLVGEIPEGKHLHHLKSCPHNCVNPSHLTPISLIDHCRIHADNARSNWERMRARTHCSNGHELTEGNTRHRRGRRLCRICERDYHLVQQRAYRARKKEESFQGR